MSARAFFSAVSLALSLSSAACTSIEVPTGPSQANPLDPEESDIVFLLNQLRTSKGLPAVNVCKSLNASASGHSDDMRDNAYLSDMGPDGSTVRTRACAAGYQAACGSTIAMAELVASGNTAGQDTFNQWTGDATSSPILTNGVFLVVGVGSSEASDGSFLWTLDLGGVADPSCQ
jgi:uncharacterized protein YkwD